MKSELSGALGACMNTSEAVFLINKVVMLNAGTVFIECVYCCIMDPD